MEVIKEEESTKAEAMAEAIEVEEIIEAAIMVAVVVDSNSDPESTRAR